MSRRHAEAILESSEWRALSTWLRIRPALGWALKEAAAKATREPEAASRRGCSLSAGMERGWRSEP
ncbi:MAG: hypothetical protein JSV86_04510 [Gemmatimonadota bacterium]|nr:MAG: hypothetical protein JSV86_04510 [Gemmatimonadota bacterium]